MHARLKAMYYSTIMPHAPPNARGVHTIGTPAGSWSVRVHAANTGDDVFYYNTGEEEQR